MKPTQVTNFQKDLEIEDKLAMRSVLKSMIKTPIDLRDYPSFKFDDEMIVLSQKTIDKKFFVEYKQDYRAYSTKNIVLEILPSINCIIDDRIDCEYFSLNGEAFVSRKNKEKIIELIDSGTIPYSKLSRHFSTNDSYFFMYSCFAPHKKDPVMSLLFRSKKLSKFFVNCYKDSPFVKTISKNSNGGTWVTISALFNFKKIMESAHRTKGILT